MTKILPIRLTEKEFQMLEEILHSENCESENRSEWFRLLLYREWNKRKGLGVPKVQDYQTTFRLIALQGRYRELAIRRRTCNTRMPAQRPALRKKLSPSSTRAANGVLGRTKNSRVTRRAGFQESAGKLK